MAIPDCVKLGIFEAWTQAWPFILSFCRPAKALRAVKPP